jgi:hypothetical protein
MVGGDGGENPKYRIFIWNICYYLLSRLMNRNGKLGKGWSNWLCNQRQAIIADPTKPENVKKRKLLVKIGCEGRSL